MQPAAYARVSSGLGEAFDLSHAKGCNHPLHPLHRRHFACNLLFHLHFLLPSFRNLSPPFSLLSPPSPPFKISESEGW
jgi:hypothetical protein